MKYYWIIALLLTWLCGFVAGVICTFTYPDWTYEHFIDKSTPSPFNTSHDVKIKKVKVGYKEGCAVDSTVYYLDYLNDHED